MMERYFNFIMGSIIGVAFFGMANGLCKDAAASIATTTILFVVSTMVVGIIKRGWFTR